MMFQDFDLKTKKLLLLFLSCLLAWWLLGGSVTCSASAPEEPQTLAVEVSELNRLDNIFSQLSQVNGRLQNELMDSRAELLKSQAALKKAQQELRMLQLQMAELKSLSESQENLLQKVNESFKQYAAEQKRTRLRVKAQRNTWEAIACLAIIGCLIK